MKLTIHNPDKLPTLKLSELIQVQGKLKDLDEKNYNKLKKSIEKKGFIVPFFVWIPAKNEDVIVAGEPFKIEKGKKYSIDGNQRSRVLLKEGFADSEFPYINIKCKDFKECKEAILVVSSQYGRIQQEGFDSFSFDLSEDFLTETIHFDALFTDFAEPDLDNITSNENRGAPDKQNTVICPDCGKEINF
jgi:hypothetical protein